MSGMSHEEMTEAAKYRKDLPLWRRAVLWYLGGSWIAAIVFFLGGIFLNAMFVSSGAVGAGVIAMLTFGLPFILKVIRIFIPFIR